MVFETERNSIMGMQSLRSEATAIYSHCGSLFLDPIWAGKLQFAAAGAELCCRIEDNCHQHHPGATGQTPGHRDLRR